MLKAANENVAAELLPLHFLDDAVLSSLDTFPSYAGGRGRSWSTTFLTAEKARIGLRYGLFLLVITSRNTYHIHIQGARHMMKLC